VIDFRESPLKSPTLCRTGVFFLLVSQLPKKPVVASESSAIPESYQLGPFANVFLFWWKNARKKRVTNPDLSFCS